MVLVSAVNSSALTIEAFDNASVLNAANPYPILGYVYGTY